MILRIGVRLPGVEATRFLGRLLAGLGLVLALSAGLQPRAAVAADPPQDPFLRVETGLHLNAIRRMAVSRDGQLLATVSDDKTVRVWTLPDGRLSTTMRVPIDVGNEGALYAVALSPDGKRLLASGRTDIAWEGKPSLYLFDMEQKILRFRLQMEASGTANHIEYSPDGRVFVVGFGDRQGIRVRNAANGAHVAGDFGYGAVWIAFAPDGTMATTGDDGVIRLYDQNYRKIREQRAPRGDEPWALAFSPDGRYLAVGYADKSRVDVLSARNLQRAFTPDTRDIPGEYNLPAVGWLSNQQNYWLMAAGSTRDRQGRATVRVWDVQSNRYADWIAAPSEDLALTQISQVLPVPGQTGLIFASLDAAWGYIGGDGQLRYQRRGIFGDFRDIELGHFGVSSDGLVVDFGMAQGGEEPYRFDVSARRLTANPRSSSGIRGPILDTGRFTVTGWKNATSPELNGRPLTDAQGYSLGRLGYLFRSLAITPDERRFLLGAEYSLHLFDESGREVQKVSTESPVWGLAVADNNRIAVAAMGDGTVAWYSLEPGRELTHLASLFPHPNGETWVMWVPEGLFDHSDTGDPNIVGFHLNNPEKGRNPTWVDFSQAYRQYYTPRIGELRLSGRGEETIRQRLASVGSLRQQVTDLPRPTVELAQYCIVPEGTRAFRRRQESQGASAAQAPAATDQQCFSLAGKSLTRAVGLSTRAFKRRQPTQQAAQPEAAEDDETGARTIDLPPGARTLELLVKVTDNGGGIGNVDVLLNDRIVDRQATRAFKRTRPAAGQSAQPTQPAGEAGAVTELRRVITLDPAESNIIQARAFRDDGLFSEVSGQVVFATPQRRAGPQAPAQPQQRRLFVVAAGVSDYAAQQFRLKFPAPDARTFSTAIKDGAEPVFDDVIVTTLLDEEVRRESVLAALERVGTEATNADTVFIYLAGHGVIEPIGEGPSRREAYFFIPQDVVSYEAIFDRGLSEVDITAQLASIQARNLFLFLDTCHSGALTFRQDVEASVGKLANEIKGRYVLAAASRDQEAFDSYDDRNGLMAHAITQALAGERAMTIARADGRIYSGDFGEFVRNRLNEMNREIKERMNLPVQVRSFFQVMSEDYHTFPVAEVQTAAATTRAEPSATGDVSPTRAPAGGQPDAAEIAFWQTVTAGNTPQEYQLYLQVYPNGHFAPIARLRAGLSAQ